MKGFVPRLRAPESLTRLREKVAAGERVTQDEALAIVALEKAFTAEANRIADEELLRERLRGDE